MSNILRETLGLLQHLSTDELKEILNDEAKFENMVKDYAGQEKRGHDSETQMIHATNRSLAEFNLDRTAEFENMKSQLIELYQNLNAVSNRVTSKLSALTEKESKFDSDTVLVILQSKASELERESDELANKFLDGTIKIENFLECFPTQRKLMHLTKAKFEKMTEIARLRKSFSSNDRSFGANNQSFGANSQLFGANTQSFGTNNQSFGANNQSFGASNQSFGANDRSFGPHNHRNSVPYPLLSSAMPQPSMIFKGDHF